MSNCEWIIIPTKLHGEPFPCKAHATRDGYCHQHHPNTRKARRAKARARAKARKDGGA